MTMNCGSRLAPVNLLVPGLRRSKSLHVMPPVVDLGDTSFSNAGETAYDSTPRYQIFQYDAFCHRFFNGRESSLLLHGLKQSP